jgi:toxin-antitoxin system PIN domain toxin
VLVVDTNVLVYAADADSPPHARCRAWIEQQRTRAEAWYTTWPILYEFLRVTTHARVMRRPWSLTEAWGFVSALLASPGLEVLRPTAGHAAIAEQVFREVAHLTGNILHDAHTAVLMRENGIRRIVTRDTDFHRFTFLEPIDPLT